MMFLIKQIMWTRRISFWKPDWKIFDNCLQSFSSKPEIIWENTFFWKRNFLKYFFWTLEMQLWQTCQKFVSSFGKKCSSAKWIKNFIESVEKTFPVKSPLDPWNAVLTDPQRFSINFQKKCSCARLLKYKTN